MKNLERALKDRKIIPSEGIDFDKLCDAYIRGNKRCKEYENMTMLSGSDECKVCMLDWLNEEYVQRRGNGRSDDKKP